MKNAGERYIALRNAHHLVVGPWVANHQPDGTVVHVRPSSYNHCVKPLPNGTFEAYIGYTLLMPTLELAKSVVDAQINLPKKTSNAKPFTVINDLGDYLKLERSFKQCERLAATWFTGTWEDNPFDAKKGAVRSMRNAEGTPFLNIREGRRVRTDPDVHYAVNFVHPLRNQILFDSMATFPTLEEATKAAEEALFENTDFWTD